MQQYYYMFGEGSKINQVLCAILINLPVFAYGASIGWMSPMTLLLQSKDSPRGTPLTDTEVSWMAAGSYLTCVAFNIIIAYMSDSFGRKPSLLFMSIAAVGCWVMKLSSMETWVFIGARVLIGITMAGAYVTCPLYTKEISENCIRGVLGTLVILGQTTGNLFLYVIGDLMPYRPVLWVCLAIPALHIIMFLWMPESPAYLVKSGKHDQAVKALAWLRCRREDDELVVNEINEIKKEQEKDSKSHSLPIKSLLQDKILRRAFTIAMVVSLAREVCGAIPVLNFAGEIFDRASSGTGLVLTPNQQAMMLGAVQVAGSALASSIVEKTGRKPLIVVTSVVSGLSMCALASWFLAKNYNVFAPEWIPVVTLCLCIFCDAAGLQPVSVVITGEIFSYKYRSSVMAITMATASFTDFLQMLFFKPLANMMGVHVAFYFFGVFCLVATLFFVIKLPETKRRTVEEIYQDLKTKKEIAKESEMEKQKIGQP